MLRRAPTTIGLTQADVDQFEANRQRKIWEQQQQQQQEQATTAQSTDGHAKTNDPSALIKNKKDRIMGGGRGN